MLSGSLYKGLAFQIRIGIEMLILFCFSVFVVVAAVVWLAANGLIWKNELQ